MEKKRNLTRMGILAAVAALVLILGGLTVAFALNGGFLSKPHKVARAIRNTFSDCPQFVRDLRMEEISQMALSGQYTMDLQTEFRDVCVKGSLINTEEQKQLLGEFAYQDVTVEGRAELDHEKLRFMVPLLTEDVFVYNYKENNANGYFAELLEEQGLTVEEWNKSLEMIFSGQEQNKASKEQTKGYEELVKGIKEQIESLTWENTDKKAYIINGDSVKAKGYRVTITRADAENFIRLLDEYMLLLYKEDVDSVKAAFEKLYDDLRYMPDVECSFYIYKNRLASIFIRTGSGYECEWLFKGGDFTMQNMEVKVSAGDGRTVSLEWNGKKEGGSEVYELCAYGMVLATFQYNTRNGRFDLTVVNDYLHVDGKLKTGEDEAGLTINVGEDFYMDVTFKKGAEPVKIEGRERNISDMSKEDWMELISGLDTI